MSVPSRPRRFGKTLNMSMIKAFCELDYKTPGDTSYQQKLFIDNGRNLAVAQDEYKELRDKVMGQVPVIYVSFKGIEGLCFKEAIVEFLRVIYEVYSNYSFLKNSKILAADDLYRFTDIDYFCKAEYKNLSDPIKLDQAVSFCKSFISILAILLHKEFNRQVLIIIDEYDVPLQKAVVAKEPYYDEMLSIIRSISISVFKQQGNPWLYKGIVTGCLKIAHQSIFTDANNFTTFNVNDELYSSFFGFTQDETENILCDFGLESKRDEIKKWYNGYRFGNDYVYCPWSLMEYCAASKRNGSNEPKPFWVNTSGNDIITLYTKNSIEANDADNTQKLQDLMDGNSVLIKLSEFSVYPDITKGMEFDTFCTMMLQTGYVTFDENSKLKGMVSVKIPNYEVRQAFETKFSYLYSNNNDSWKDEGFKLLDALMGNDIDKAQAIINSVLRIYISIRHSGSEQYYHGLMQGLLISAAQKNNIKVLDESESGIGYSDIILKDFMYKRAIILEFKRAGDEDLCLRTANEATEQIIKKRYADLFDTQYTQVYGIGIGFCRKYCEISSLGNIAKRAMS
ncbi:AAA family ATPase [Anaerobiospirillum thomasii]|uniref:AAA family ATPase n=1 Tax=Anaerobiospirillum thomasii TaxID=179995 RepID=UPI002482C2AF|nr:AAA family ATPase [Anaerobiospirillum thomasii]